MSTDNFVPVGGHAKKELVEAPLIASLTDETTEGKLNLIPEHQQTGHVVVRTGDRTNDATDLALEGMNR